MFDLLWSTYLCYRFAFVVLLLSFYFVIMFVLFYLPKGRLCSP